MVSRTLLLILVGGLAFAASAQAGNPRVKIETSKGTILVELDPAKAPKTVENFLTYVRAGFYDGMIFHRVIPNFMIQGGGVDANYQGRSLREPITNEAGNGLSNLRGTIAMARTGEVNSATAQFFINHKDNKGLDHRNESADGFGYCVFGKVVRGMDVVDAIAQVPTGPGGPFAKDAPMTPVVIKYAVVEGAAKPAAKPPAKPRSPQASNPD